MQVVVEVEVVGLVVRAGLVVRVEVEQVVLLVVKKDRMQRLITGSR